MDHLNDHRFSKGDSVTGYIYDPNQRADMADKWKISATTVLENGAVGQMTGTVMATLAVSLLVTALSF